MQKPREAKFWSLFRKAIRAEHHWATYVWIGLLSCQPLLIFLLFSSVFERLLAGITYGMFYFAINFFLLRTLWLRDTEGKEKKNHKKKSKKVERS